MEGNILAVKSVWGSQKAAEAILKRIKGYRYSPYEATDARFDAAAELGDGISVNGIQSGIYRQELNFGPSMAANIEAPQESDIDHEYSYVPRTVREENRRYADIKATLKINRESIAAEVEARTKDAETLKTSITQNATSIAAKVSKSGGDAKSFGWTLTDSDWTLKSNSKAVLKADKSGLTVSGTITATAGTIGGCKIENGVLKIASANITSIDAKTITAGTLSVDRLEAKSITGGKIADATVTGGNVAGATLTGGNVAGYTLGSGNFQQGINDMLSTAYSFATGAISAAQIQVSNAIYMGSERFAPTTFSFTDGKGRTVSIRCIGLTAGYN